MSKFDWLCLETTDENTGLKEQSMFFTSNLWPRFLPEKRKRNIYFKIFASKQLVVKHQEANVGVFVEKNELIISIMCKKYSVCTTDEDINYFSYVLTLLISKP